MSRKSCTASRAAEGLKFCRGRAACQRRLRSQRAAAASGRHSESASCSSVKVSIGEPVQVARPAHSAAPRPRSRDGARQVMRAQGPNCVRSAGWPAPGAARVLVCADVGRTAPGRPVGLRLHKEWLPLCTTDLATGVSRRADSLSPRGDREAVARRATDWGPARQRRAFCSRQGGAWNPAQVHALLATEERAGQSRSLRKG